MKSTLAKTLASSLFGNLGHLQILNKTQSRNEKKERKKTQDGEVLLMIRLLCEQQERKNISSLRNGC